MTWMTDAYGVTVYRSQCIGQCKAMVETPHGDDHTEVITLREAVRQLLAVVASMDTQLSYLEGRS